MQSGRSAALRVGNGMITSKHRDLRMKVISDVRRIEVSYNSDFFHPRADFEQISDCLAQQILDEYLEGGWMVDDYWFIGDNLCVEFIKA